MIFSRRTTVAALLACCLVESVVVGTSQAQNENCTLPEDPGPCFGSFTRYFFDTQTQECKQFTYGGCEGNGNNFDTFSKCLEICKKSSTMDSDGGQALMDNNIAEGRPRGKRNISEVCLQTPDPGKCQEFKTMYYYDFQSKRCTTFLYGGCNGNGNKFESAGECERACKTSTPGPRNVCLLQPDVGPCRAVENKFFYNDTSKMCEEFVYGGCQGNENRFDTEKDCRDACKLPLPRRKQDVCTLSLQPGPCEGRIARYFYNSSSECCEQFIYGGCRGNKNRFKSMGDCQKKCSRNVQPRNVCSLAPETGPCRASIPRYFFNQSSGACEQFNYGGCEGNENNFQTVEDCERKCGGSVTPVPVDRCSLEPETGPCLALFPRYFYNSTSGNCETFTYGGCEGNENRFKTVEDCERNCSRDVTPPPIERCLLAPETGPCLALFPKYFYNSTSGKCELFTYGGCGGNKNRFETELECQQQCSLGVTEKPRVNDDVCKLPAESGSCLAYFPKYHFNTTSGKCERFIFGGCGGNKNRFDTEVECEKRCPSQEKPEVPIRCLSEPDSGPCDGLFPRFFYNKSSEVCESFVYGGCGGNDNKFVTRFDCQKTCVGTVTPNSGDVCELPADSGPCYAYIPRFFYNTSSDLCEQFIYGGCKGNENRFETKEDCQKKCSSKDEPSGDICLLPPVTGPCKANMPRYFYNATSDKCEKFIYGGCQGNENNFERMEDCENRCGDRCLLKPETGPCKAHIPRYFYNGTSGACEQFIYGGCEGNENRFETVEDCEGKCGDSVTPVPVDRCSLEPETGPCLALFPRYFYNSTSGNCETFTYGGCEGNENQFETVEDCEGNCTTYTSPLSVDRCSLPPETGPCRAKLPRFFHNATSNQCEKFFYGGCLGNENRFETIEDCQGNCSTTFPTTQPINICLLPPETGRCEAYIPRYFYNATSEQCQKFIYGGCGGNGNRFEKQSQCLEKCAVFP